jgi:hypothetical protein
MLQGNLSKCYEIVTSKCLRVRVLGKSRAL